MLSATKPFGHFHLHLVHFKIINTATTMIFVIFNLFCFLKKKKPKLMRSACHLVHVHVCVSISIP